MSEENAIRVGFFIGIFAVAAICELLVPRRRLTTSKTARWVSNLCINFLNPVFVNLISPVLAIGMAVKSNEGGWGLLNNIEISSWLEIIISVVALDFVIYIQHVLFHSVPTLWRLHMVHHSDLDIDVTTGLRFHPIEIVISLAIKIAAVVVIGPHVMAVLIFEIVLNATSMFNHANLRLPLGLDRILRLIVVTPDMHRVHHSVVIRETNSNFGFNLPWWDRLFGTYKDQPSAGHLGMNIGLAQFRDSKKLTFIWMLLLPFIGDPGRQSINRH